MSAQKPHCRPGTTDAMQRLADENEQLRSELEKATEARQAAQIQLEQYQKRQAASGLCIDAALRGESRPTEDYWDGRMEAVCKVVTERDDLAAKVDRLAKTIPCTVRQYRHNNDNSPNLFEPEHGFVIAYEREAVDRLLAETPVQSTAHLRAAGAREALERAMKPRGFSDTVVRVGRLKEIINQMEVES